MSDETQIQNPTDPALSTEAAGAPNDASTATAASLESTGTGTGTATDAIQPAAPVAAPPAPVAAAIAPDGIFVDGTGLVPHPDLPVGTGFLQALEAEVKRAEHAGEHAAHAVLNDLHMLAVQIKAKAAAAMQHVEGTGAEMVEFLHRVL